MICEMFIFFFTTFFSLSLLKSSYSPQTVGAAFGAKKIEVPGHPQPITLGIWVLLQNISSILSLIIKSKSVH
jgi:hypothetical protein